MNYNKSIEKNHQYGYSNICAYPEFFNYCLRHNLSAIEITILNYILSNTKEWEISPTTIGNVYNIPRETASRALTKLQSKLNGDLIISSRSKGGNGTLVNATKVYEEIYNEISGKKQLENSPSPEESEEITEKAKAEQQLEDELLGKEEHVPTEEDIKMRDDLLSNITPAGKRDWDNRQLYNNRIDEQIIWLRKRQIA